MSDTGIPEWFVPVGLAVKYGVRSGSEMCGWVSGEARDECSMGGDG